MFNASMSPDRPREPGLDAMQPPEGDVFVGMLGSPGESCSTSNWYYDWQCEAWESHTPSALKSRRRGQGLLAWIAVPALVALIVLLLSDMWRPAASAAAPGGDGVAVRRSVALPRLLGKWMSTDKGHLLCFVHVDPDSLSGTYVQFPRGCRPGWRVRFEVIHEEPEGDRLIIKQWSEDLKGVKLEPSDGTSALDVSIYIPPGGQSLTWIEIQGGRPVLKVYERVDDSAAISDPPS